MSEQYTPTTEEGLGMLRSYLYEYGAECDMNLPGNSPDEIVDRWLAKHDAEVAAKALDDASYEIFVSPAEIDPGKRMAFHRGADAVYDALRARVAEIRERES